MDIVAIAGGGGYGIDRYIFDLTGKDRPAVCYMPTASGDSFADIASFWRWNQRMIGSFGWLELIQRTEGNLVEFFKQFDVIYAGGGNTVTLLSLWKSHRVHDAIRAVAREKPLVCAGNSAGALCWFSGGLTDSYGPGYNPLPEGLGLGFIPEQFCPHMNHPKRRPLFRLYLEGTQQDGIGAEDNVALHYKDGELVRAVTDAHRGEPEAVRFVYDAALGRAVEVPLEMALV